MSLSELSFRRPHVVAERPVPHWLPAPGRDRERAAAILQRHAHSPQDFFKLWDDKSLFFTHSWDCFLSYRVWWGYAVAFGDPVGPEDRLETAVREFRQFCVSRGWRCGFHQIRHDRLAIYRRLGFSTLHIGDDAIVDLAGFSLQGAHRKELRNTVNKLERLGVSALRFDPPLPDAVIDSLEEVSREWLLVPGRRERRFTLGRFDRGYVRSTPVYTAVDANGRALAFLNMVPSYQPGLASLDLMRRRAAAPNGVMDFLLVKTFLDLDARGIRRFSLGMAPVFGPSGDETPTLTGRMVRALLPRLDFLFSYEGLRRYKAKFASAWEPRYDAYRSILDLPRLALALRAVTEIPERERRAA